MKNTFPLSLFLFIPLLSSSQTTPFNTISYVDVNNIKASLLVHGDMWWQPDSGIAKCEFPRGSQKNIAFAAGLWMAGYDAGTSLKVSAQTYRQNGNDFWPGPLEDTVAITWAESEKWAKIWKLNRSELNTFLGTSNHTAGNTPPAILTWPAKGNVYAKGNNNANLNLQTRDYAPFVDVNSDGIYNALDGDHPLMKGDQMLWYLFNDHGPDHSLGGTPIGIEIACMAYAYKRNSVIDNAIFYEYTLVNKTGDLDSFVLGIHADMDLGYSLDDYVGFDSARNLGVVYNAVTIDGSGQLNAYADSIPVAGVEILQWNTGDTCQVNLPTGSFIYYNNNNSSVTGNPGNGAEINNYLRHRWKNGSHLAARSYDTVALVVYDNGTGGGAPVNYVYDGEPNVAGDWSECMQSNTPGDRRFVIASSPVDFAQGQSQKFAFALITTPLKFQNACPNNMNFNEIKTIADTAQNAYCNPLAPVLSVFEMSGIKSDWKVYPNPGHDHVYIRVALNKNEGIKLQDVFGREIKTTATRTNEVIDLNIAHLPAGVYYIFYHAGGKTVSGTFIKQ